MNVSFLYKGGHRPPHMAVAGARWWVMPTLYIYYCYGDVNAALYKALCLAWKSAGGMTPIT